jgi:Carboxypeptidase regulatory-like domain
VQRTAVLVRASAAFVFIAVLGACSESQMPTPLPPSPTSASPPTPSPPVPPTAALSGTVMDTVGQGLSDARVEITEGLQAGAFAMTESNGRFSIPGPFPFNVSVSVRVSKDGYVTATQQIYVYNQDRMFFLEAIGSAIDITGEYTVTFLADSTCKALPDISRTRTYQLSITRRLSPPIYEGTLSGATFYYSLPFRFSVSGRTVTWGVGEYGFGFTEDLGAATMEIWAGGTLDAPVNGSSSSGSFVGGFTYCDGVPPPSLGHRGLNWDCPVQPPAYCEATNHQVTLARR